MGGNKTEHPLLSLANTGVLMQSQLRLFAYSNFSGSLGKPWAVGLKIFKSEVKCSIKIKEGKKKNPHL